MVRTTMRALVMATSVAALMLGVGAARAEEMDHSKMDHSKMDHSKMDHGSAPVQWADPGAAQSGAAAGASGAGGMSGMNHGGMNHGGMNHGGMNHGGMQGMDHGGGMDHGSGGMDHGGGMGMMNQMLCGFAEHVDGRLGYMKAELHLTDEQTSAWNKFADAWRAAADNANKKCAAAGGMDHSKMDHGGAGVLHKLTMMETHMVDHLEVVRAQKAAIEPLLAALNDDQKKAAGEAFSNIMKVGMQMNGGGMNHGGGGMSGGMGGMKH